MSTPQSHQNGGFVDEVSWRDRDAYHGRVIGYDEVRLEQPDAPDDAVAIIEVGEPPKDGTIWAVAAYLTVEQAVDAALVLLEAAAQGRAQADPKGPPKGPTDDPKRRWRLHVAACSIEDMTFWVERLPSGQHKATEVETGVTGAPADDARGALDNYFDGHLWSKEAHGA